MDVVVCPTPGELRREQRPIGTYRLISIVPANISFSDPEFHKCEPTLMGSRNVGWMETSAVVIKAIVAC